MGQKAVGDWRIGVHNSISKTLHDSLSSTMHNRIDHTRGFLSWLIGNWAKGIVACSNPFSFKMLSRSAESAVMSNNHFPQSPPHILSLRLWVYRSGNPAKCSGPARPEGSTPAWYCGGAVRSFQPSNRPGETPSTPQQHPVHPTGTQHIQHNRSFRGGGMQKGQLPTQTRLKKNTTRARTSPEAPCALSG